MGRRSLYGVENQGG